MEGNIVNDLSSQKSDQLELLLKKSFEEKQTFVQSIKKRLLSSSSGIDIIATPTESLDTIVGMEDIKREILTAMKERGGFQRLLLFGASGCGKAHLARAISSNLDCNLILLSRVQVLFEWEEHLDTFTKIVCEISQERSTPKKSSILFLNHVDFYSDLGPRQKNRLVRFLENVQTVWFEAGVKLAIIGTSFQPQKLPKEVVHCFNKFVYVPTPNLEERKLLILKEIEKICEVGHLMTDEETVEIAKDCFSIAGGEINALVRNAFEVQNPPGLGAGESGDLERAMKNIRVVECRSMTKEDFDKTLELGFVRLEPTTFDDFQDFYQAYGGGTLMSMFDREHYNFQEVEGDSATATSLEEIDQEEKETWFSKLLAWF